MKIIKTLIVIMTMTLLMTLQVQAKQLWGLVAEFRTEDLMKVNAWEMIGKKGKDYNTGKDYNWAIIEKDTADMEIGHIVGILDTEDPGIKKVGFFYEKLTTYRVDYHNINFYVFNMISNLSEPAIRSVRLDNKPFPIDMDYKG